MIAAEPKAFLPKERPLKIRASNRVKVLLCYTLSFALPLLWLLGGLVFLYPYQLVGSAPLIAENLSSAFPVLKTPLRSAAAQAADPAVATAQAWRAALASRDRQWMVFLLCSLLFAWGLTLLGQLLWRETHRSPWQAARACVRAIRDYRLMMTALWALNGAVAAGVWFLGMQFIQGKILWDYVLYLSPYVLNGLAAWVCFRLAAPPVLSGKKAFFKRL